MTEISRLGDSSRRIEVFSACVFRGFLMKWRLLLLILSQWTTLLSTLGAVVKAMLPRS